MDKRKHRRSRRFLSALMVLAMLVSLLPAGAYATTPAEDSTTNEIVEQTPTNEPGSEEPGNEPDGDVTEPLEGTEPSVPEQPTEPTEPTEPEEPTDPEEPAGDDGTEATLNDGVNIIQAGAENTTYNIGDGQVVMIANQAEGAEPITFKDCTFNLSGKTVKISGNQEDISYNNGEVATKLFISGAVNFENCHFVTADGAGKSTSAGWDAAIYFYSGDINVTSCTLEAEGYNGQFLGLYGSEGAVTFKDSIISTIDNKNGWSYAMYASSVLNLDHSKMTATGMIKGSSNINAFYSVDANTGHDAVFIKNGSVVDFSDNQGGGFAVNNGKIHVSDSSITVNDNAGNACNSGYWIVENSSITMNGNRGGHALSCIGFEMTDTDLEILHNGYAGVYIQSTDSSLTDCDVDVRCNGEKLLSYSAGDVWLNGHTLTVNGGTSDVQEGSPWLGGVGRTGAVETGEGTSIVAYDLNSNSVDNLKSDTEAVLDNEALALNGDENKHTLLLNPFMKSDYARGSNESVEPKDNDADLFEDARITDTETYSEILGAGKAKIGDLTDAQLSHHKYDWNAGETAYEATSETYGATKYPCTDVCADYVNHATEHPNSFDCEGTYVYAPLVGLDFDANAGTDKVAGMPDDQTTITYNDTVAKPTETPVRESSDPGKTWVFTGWYADADCNTEFDFTQALTDNWTTVYAGWKEVENMLTVTAADLTIYMGGDDGYEGVVGNDGSLEVEDDKNSLPTPMFTIKDADGNDIGADEMVFTSAGDEDGTTKTWTAKAVPSTTEGKASGYYTLEAAEGQDPVRVTYTPTSGENKDPVLSDEFDITQIKDLFATFEVQMYTNTVNLDQVTGTKDGKEYAVQLGDPGTLTVRAVENTEENAAVVSKVTDTAPTEKLTANTGLIVADKDTVYTVNNYDIPAPDTATPSLLFDTIVTNDGEPREAVLEDRVSDQVTTPSGHERKYQSQYLDLVDATNGNLWLKASKPITVYWAYPADTDASDDFTLWHFEGLHRDGANSGFDIEDVDSDATKLQQVEITKGEYGISFTVEPGGFSPFVLTWTESTGGGGWVPDNPDEEDPDTPELNTEDHFSYIVGYPEDYRTGEKTDDESLWPVKPQGNITRAEVATIFYRLLTDEARTEHWTRSNDYSDVAAESWYNTPVSTLSAMGIVRGYEDGSFRPDAPITRAEFAAIAVRFFENDNVNYEEGLFTDIEGSEWFADAVAAAQEHGIVGGYPDGSFQPNKAITRAEACSIVNRTVDRIPDKDHLLPDDQMRVWPDNSNTNAWYYADMQEATSGHVYDWVLDDNDEPLYEQWTGDLPEVDWVQVEIDQEEKHGLR